MALDLERIKRESAEQQERTERQLAQMELDHEEYKGSIDYYIQTLNKAKKSDFDICL